MESDHTAHSYDDGANGNRTCPQCGEASVTTFWHHDRLRYGTGGLAVDLPVDLPVRRCGSCSFEFLDHEAERLRHEAVCRHLGLLSPAKVLGIRKRHGMTRAAFAQFTGFGEATLNRWENGLVIQNLANDRYLRLLDKPGGMSLLKSLLAPKPAQPQVPVPSNLKKFRVLNVSDQQRRSQSGFQLRLAS